jgi:segregation and condensation protein B
VTTKPLMSEPTTEPAMIEESIELVDGLSVSRDQDQPSPFDSPGLPLRAQLEAVLLTAEEPIPSITLAERLAVPLPDVESTVRQLAEEYLADGRGFELREVGGGWRYYTAASAGEYVERFVLAGQTARLSQAALETLAVIAYQQPVSRGRIAAVRGVNVDGVVRTLLTRRLIEESGVDPEGGAMTYRTTTYFLERIGLRDLSELPPLAPLLPEADEIELT